MASLRTPSPALPAGDNGRFVDTSSPCEWAEEYRPGGFHPVDIGDSLGKDGRYRVIRKLGYGSFSIVWLTVDQVKLKYACVKVMMSKHSSDAAMKTELELWKTLRELAKIGPQGYSNHVLSLLDSFVQEGPNGKHSCLVYTPMGGTVASMASKLPQYRHTQQRINSSQRYSKTMAKQILRASLKGLYQLHSCNIVHGDFQPGNMLFTAARLKAATEAQLKHDLEGQRVRLQRIDGQQDKWAPRYLCLPQPLYEYVDFDKPVHIKLSDLGGAFAANAPPKKIVTPVALRAPETILGLPVDWRIDIWSFGCVMYELLTGEALFYTDPAWPQFGRNDEDVDDDHMLEFNDVLGTVPEDIRAEFPRSSSLFESNGDLLDKSAQPDSPAAAADAPPVPSRDLETRFQESMPPEIDAEEAQQITRLIRKILKYNPAERPSADDLLKDPWFADIEEGIEAEEDDDF